MRIQIQARRHQTASDTITVKPLRWQVSARPQRILDFDVECRPLHFYGEYVSKEITAMAWAWVHRPEDITAHVLTREDENPREMLAAFCDVFNQADVVTGHFVLGFDLPLIQGALTELHMPTLGDVMVQDTKIHLIRRHGMSGSQENIGAMLHLEHPKVQMNQAKWREANRLTPEGIALAKERVTGDVRQHIEMRQRLLELGYLGPAKLWKSGTATPEVYTP